MWRSVLLVGCGGFIGAALRYLIATAVQARAGATFPWGTLAVNVLGCFIIGVLMGLTDSERWPGPQARLLLVTGLLGGLTTFSTFSHETERLLATQPTWALVNAGGSVLAGVLAVLLGRGLVKLVAG
jgi:CrcB protein